MIVTVDVDELGVEGGVPPPGLVGVDCPGLVDVVGFDCAPPPQLWSASPKASNRHTTPILWIPLRFPSAITIPANGNSSVQTIANIVVLTLGVTEFATEAGVEIVSVALAAVDPGVIEAGEKLHVAPPGSPEHESTTASLNAPFSGATLMLYVAASPCFTV